MSRTDDLTGHPSSDRAGGRALAVTAALGCLATGGLGAAAARSLTGDRSDPATALLVTAALLGTVLAGWFTVATLLHLLALVPGAVGRAGQRASAAVTPALLRRALAMSIGLGAGTAVLPGASVAAAATTVATTAQTTSPDWRPHPSSAPDPGFAESATESVETSAESAGEDARPVGPDPDPGWVPHRPRAAQPAPDVIGAPRSAGPAADEDEGYVVRRGDCLWDIVARHLGDAATTSTIAAEVPRWHAANRSTIGADPDLILPGTTLHAPDTRIGS